MALADLIVKVGANITGFQTAMQDVSKSLSTVATAADKNFRGFEKIGGQLQGLGTQLSVALTLPLAGIATAATQSFMEIDTLRRGLDVITGSAAETARQFEALREVAKLPGLGLEEVVDASVKLQTLGFSFEKTRDIILQFGNALASVGRGREDLQETLRQLSQIEGRGRVTMDNLRIILERVPQLNQIIRQTYGPEALGDTAKYFETIGVSAHDFVETITRELGKLPRVAGSLKNDFENMKDTMTIAFARIGEAIAPFVTMAINTLVPAIEGMVNAFTSLPAPIQASIIVMGSLVAAAGPLIYIGGQLILSFAAISKGLMAMSGFMATTAIPAFANIATAVSMGLIPALTTGELMLLRFGQAALIAGAAFAAWTLGTWLRENIPLIRDASNAVADFLLKITGFGDKARKLGEADDALARAAMDSAFVIQKLEAALKAKGKTVDKAGKTTEQYAAALRSAAKQLSVAEPATKKYGAALESTVTKQERLNEAVHAAREELDLANKKYTAGIAPIDGITKAQDKLRAALKAAHPEWTQAHIDVEIYKNDLNVLLPTQEDANKAFGMAAEVYEAMTRAMRPLVVQMADLVNESHQLADAMSALSPANERALESLRALAEASNKLPVALGEGIKSGAEARAEYERLSRELEELRSQTDQYGGKVASVGEIRQKEIQVLKAQIEVYKDAGLSVEELERQLEQLEGRQDKNVNAWGRWGKQVSTIINDAGKQFADGIKKLFDNSENRKLDQQAQELRNALAAQSSLFEGQTATLAEEYEAQTAKAKDEYAQRTAADKAELDEQLENLRENFEKRTAEDKKQLDKQLANLVKHLADVDKRFKRREEDIKKRAEDETRDLKEELSDRERDYRHYVEDQQLKLELLDGDTSESAARQRREILLNLQQRSEDMQDVREDIQQKLIDTERDLKIALDREVQDYKEQRAEIEAEQAALVVSYQNALAEQTLALETEMSKRQTKYEAALAAQTLALEAELSNQTTKYEEALADALAAYEQFKADTALKLAAIEAEHTTIWGRIGSLAISVLDSMGEALLRIAGEEIMGFLFKKLVHLIDVIFPGLKKAIGGIFSGIGGQAAGTAADAASDAAGAAGGLGGTIASGVSAGMTGIIGAVSGVVSAVSGVISNFQLARQEGTLNAIEQHTKVIALGLTGISAPWEDWSKAWHGPESMTWFTKRTMQALEDTRDNVLRKELMGVYLGGMWDTLGAIQREVALTNTRSTPLPSITTISNNTFNITGSDPREIAIQVANILMSGNPAFQT